ncbi:MAG TPA: GNAT family N-acetyltransferase [Rubrobacter sp.]|nr:GNAT family N-acetyltransferase [Rubrobacter sp.]
MTGSRVENRFLIETARFSLRPVSINDLDDLHRLWTDPAVREFFWDGETISRERAEAAVREGIGEFDRHGFGLWAAEMGEDFVGFCGLRLLDNAPEVEVLYGITPSRWGEGFATEVALAMVRYGFDEAGLDRIVGIADRENAASRRVLEKIGMTFEEHVLYEGREEARYSIRKSSDRPSAAPG